MKKLIFLFLLVGLTFTHVKAQVIDTLSKDKVGFMKDLKQQFDATNRSELKDLYKNFDDQVKQGKISDEVINKLIITCNKILEMRGKAYPQLQQTLENYMELNALPLAANEWTMFQETLLMLIDNSKKGDTKTTLDFMEFAIPLFRENALFYSTAKIWSLQEGNFKLSYGTEGPIVQVDRGIIKGKTPGDSLVVFNTSGSYVYFKTTWNGQSGSVNWERAGFPATEVFATFNNYEIDMSTQAYLVENVTFTYKNYFQTSIVGKLEDKIVTAANPQTTRYPRFSAERANVPEQRITENVFYYGGFTLAGSKVQGSSDGEKSELIIYKENSNVKMLRALTNSITINLPQKISSSNAEVSLYFDKDSIYHPSINLFYDLETKTIKLLKGEGSLAQSRFTNSYHNIDLNLDVLTWDLKSDEILLSMITTSGLKSANFESKEYFSSEKMKELRGNVSYDPLTILKKYTETNMQNYLYAFDFAKLISPNLTVQQIKPLIFSLVQEGFITFDEETEKIDVKDKVGHYVLANAKKKDFDNITITSNDNKSNGTINLADNSMHLTGVKSVPISLANLTSFFPANQRITIEKNRDMEFDGLFFSGRFDFFGKDHHFLYEDFNMELPQIDTLIINIPDGDKLDQYGNPRLKPINSTLQELKGNLNINIPINKSGSSELAQFPIFESTQTAKVFYDGKETRGGTYKREDFYFEIPPFTIDSLMYIDKKTLKFEGELHSAGIFPDLKEPLRLQDDLSLGFKLKSPPEGLEIYQGKGRFISEIELNNEGLSGSGIIKYKSTSFESKNIMFFPDSLLAITDTFGIEESKGAYESPWVKSENNKIEWYPYLDSMVAYSNKEKPFKMFDESVKLDGLLEITDKGIYGSGLADWEDAQLTSNRFKFNAEELLADSASLLIKTIDGDKVSFNTPNVNVYVDFNANTGYFKSNTNENRTEFNYNQYATTIDEFFWDIDNKQLQFSVPEGSSGAPFVSLNLKQDTLSFIATKADYNLENSIIEARGVSEIFVADSRVIPDKGRVTIYPEAKMETLTNAVIEASAESKRHIMEDVTITINGKYDINASGKYKYIAENTPTQYINLPKIEVIVADSTQMDKKNGVVNKIIHAKGLILQSENFIIYPNVQYYGDIDMYSTLDDLKIKGYAKVDFRTPFIISDFLQVEGKVNPESLDLTLDGAKDPTGKPIRTGIFVNKIGINPIYTNILNNQIGPLDVALFEANGILKHDPKLNIYTFGNEAKMNSSVVMKGNVLKFSPQDNSLVGQGSFDFALAFGAIDEKFAGEVRTDLIENQYDFNTSIIIPLDIDKSIVEKMAYYLYEDNFDNTDVNYDNEDLHYHWAEFVSDKSLEKMQEEINTTGFFSRPKDLVGSLVFTDVDMKYYPAERVYRSEGKFGLAFVGDKGVHKMINGYLEFGHRMGSDYLNIYLKTSYNDYVYFTFTTTLLEITSSFSDIVGAINALDPSKRKVKGENNTFYLYTGINEMKAKGFIQRMKILEEGGTLPQPEPPKIKIEQPLEKGNEKGEKDNGPEEITPSDSNVPKEVLDFEEQQSKGKKKKDEVPDEAEKIDVEEKVEEDPALNPSVPQEILDFENNSKGKKNKDDAPAEVEEKEVEETPAASPSVPQEILDFENSDKEKKKKDDMPAEVEEKEVEETPAASPSVPQEILDFENNSKGKKKKGE